MSDKSGNLKIVFLAANCTYSYTNLADWCLRAYTADLGWDWETAELVVGEQPYPALYRIIEAKPTLLAASLYVFNRDCVLSLLRRYKALDPDCVVVVGGPELLGDNEPLLRREPCINAAIRGEGEIPFRKLLERWCSGRDLWEENKGCTRIDTDGKYVDNGMADAVRSLDEIPSPVKNGVLEYWSHGVLKQQEQPPFSETQCSTTPSRHLVGRNLKSEGRHSTPSKPFLQLESSRGCRGSCSFCVSGLAGSVRYLSVERLRADLAAIRDAGFRGIRMIDRTFNDKPSRCVQLLRMFREEFPEMHFHLEIDPALVTEEELAELAAAPASEPATREADNVAVTGKQVSRYGTGKWHMDVGIQTFSPAVTENCNRSGAIRNAECGLRKLCEIDAVEVHADLIAGLPGQTLDQVFNDVRRLVGYKPAEIQLELLKLLPGTRINNEREKWGMVASPEPPYEVIRTNTMSEADMATALWLSKLVDWFHAPQQLRDTVRRANELLPAFWQKLCDFCRSRPRLWMKPSLDNRFRLLHEFFQGCDERLTANLDAAVQKHKERRPGRS